MRAENASWPYNAPGRDDPDWSADNGPVGDGRTDWTAGDDSWPPNGASPGWPYGEDHPSWPASGGPDWTAGNDSWPPNGASPGWPYGEDHPSWPAGGEHPSWPRAGGGSAPRGREPAAAPRHDPRSPTAPPPARAARVRVPADGGPDGAAQWSGQHAAGTAPPSNYEVAFGNGPVQVLLPSAGPEWPTGAGAGEMPHLTGERQAELHDPLRQDAGGFQNADSVRLAERILSDADSQAAGIRQEALDQANAIREAAEREADEVRRLAAYQVDAAREAERAAEEIKRQAEYQANAIREAAAREADELRAGAIRLSAELGQVAAYVTRTLTIPAITAGEPEALPGPQVTEDTGTGPAMPAAPPQDWQQDAQPAARPRPRTRPRRQVTEDAGPAMPVMEPQDWQQDALPAPAARRQARPRPQVTEDFAGPAMPIAEPQPWEQQPWEQDAPPAPAARPRPQARPRQQQATEGYADPALPGAEPDAWQNLEEAWEQEESRSQKTWQPDSWAPEASPAARPRPQGRAAPARTAPAREGRAARTAPARAGRAAPARAGGAAPARTAPPREGRGAQAAPSRAGRASAGARRSSGKGLDAKGRQRRFKNRMVFAYLMLLLIPLFIGVAEVAVHGFPFFVFRDADAGAGNGADLEDNDFLHPAAADNNAKPSTPKPAPTPSKAN